MEVEASRNDNGDYSISALCSSTSIFTSNHIRPTHRFSRPGLALQNERCSSPGIVANLSGGYTSPAELCQHCRSANGRARWIRDANNHPVQHQSLGRWTGGLPPCFGRRGGRGTRLVGGTDQRIESEWTRGSLRWVSPVYTAVRVPTYQ